MALVLAGSCKKDIASSKEKHFIHINKLSIEFSDMGGEDSIVIEATQPWKIIRSDISYWIHFSKDSGNIGKTILYISAERQLDNSSRQVDVTFSSSNVKPETLKITQKHKVRIDWISGYAFADSMIDIQGSGFSSIPEENMVTVNGIKANVVSADRSRLKFIMPRSCGTGPVIVSVGGDSDTSRSNLLYYWTGIVEVIAGGGDPGYLDGPAATSKFNHPEGISIDSEGVIYIADYANSKVRKITPTGQVTTVPGRFAPWQNPSGPITDYGLPTAVKPGVNGKLYITEFISQCITSFEPPASTQIFAGGGSIGFTDAWGTEAKFHDLTDLAIDAAGNIFVADHNNYSIRKITPDGQVTTFAGGQSGSLDGQGTTARFNRPMGITIDDAGNLFTTDYYNNSVRKITPTGLVTTIASNAPEHLSGLSHPKAITVSSNGTIFISENDSFNMIRLIYQDKDFIETIGKFANGTGAPFNFSVIGGLWAVTNNILLATDTYHNRICRLTIF
ncbi:hypothetical protein GCM10027051_31790 [Niabella terrae]